MSQTFVEQGSEAWRQIRLGKVTASRVADVVAKTKTGYSTSRANYAAELLVERLTGEPAPSYTNAAMQWGIDHEPDARAAYEFRTDCEVMQVGFVAHPSIHDAGASPDGLVGDDGLVEIKCPQAAAHIETLLSGTVPGKYITQMQFQMSCSGRAWCDYVSFHPHMPERMRLFSLRVKRDEEPISVLEKEVRLFLAELKTKMDELTKRYGEPVNYLMAG